MGICIKRVKRIRRHKRVRAKISGTAKVPRLCVFRSNKHIYTQIINDEKSQTLISAGDKEIKKSDIKNKEVTTEMKKEKDEKNKESLTGKIYIAYSVGKLIAKKAEEKKINKVVFDRGGYKYHGRIKALADGAKEGGLKF